MGAAKKRTKVELVLMILVTASIVRQFFLGNYHNMFLGVLTLILFMVPKLIEKKLGVSIPAGLQAVILIFIFSAEILGEIHAFYVKISIWDTILHTTNGFLMAAIGFAMIDVPVFRGVCGILLLHDGRGAVGVLRIRDGLVLPDRYAEGLDPACDQFSQAESGRRECAGEGGR